MKHVAAKHILLSLILVLFISVAFASDCTKCDCIHLPCPKECKPCCGFKVGMIHSKTGNMLVIDREKFSIMSDTEISGHLTEGSQAKVYFRKSEEGNQATKIVAVEPQAKGSANPN
jgi:hypothetical protein